MASVNRTIQTEQDRVMAARLIENRTLPFTLSLTDGKHRSTAQNRLQHMWMKEISEQLGDMTEHYARAYCKLTIGVPILRAQNEAFRLRYDEIIRPLPYEQKIAIMMEPLDFPVTRLMNVRQKTEYLEGIIRHFGEKGIVLTMPEEVRQELRMNHESEDTHTDDADRPAASEEVDAGSIPASPASASSTDAPWIVTAARMLWAATNANGDTDENLRLIKAQKAAVRELMPSDTPKPIREKAQSIFDNCEQVVMRSLDPADAKAIIAGIAGITEEDLSNG